MVLIWVVTGCSTGLGKEICISALNRGDKVIATCRGNAENRLSDLVAQGAKALSLDVAAPLEEIQAFAQKALGIYGQVDVVCNNAGYVQQGAFEETTPEETLRQYQTLVFGPLNITRAFLPHMRERETGAIGMIGSRGAEMTIPGLGLYTSCKAALAALSQTLAAEVEPFNIKVTCIEPGDFRTEVFSTPITSSGHILEYEAILAPTLERLNSDFKQPGDPHKGAERIVDILTGSGHAKGRKLPFRVPLGDDAYERAMVVVETRSALAQEWKAWSTGTNF